MAGFAAETLARLEQVDEIEIETGRRGRRTIIWIVVDGDVPYIRSVRGADGAWYRAAVRDGSATLHVDSLALPVRVVAVRDQAEIGRVSGAITRKYEARWPGPTAAMLRPDVLETTLRVVSAA